MTTSSEDVLLQVGQVRYKKGDGTLYVMNERLAWMMDHRDTVSVSHRFTDIKMQKISPDGKPKVQLQVVLFDGSTSTFQFVNRQGPVHQKRERDNVKELLQHLLAKHKTEINKELEEKNRILSENPAMLQLYRDLVITQVISSEEFWENHASQFSKKTKAPKQDIGVSGAFLADIKPQTDGCNGLRYNLTLDVIQCIFKTYPTVKQKHMDEVPTKVTEGEFWTKFFQSHYFHRDRMSGGTRDLFTDCAKMDDLEIKKELNIGFDGSLVDLRSYEEKFMDDMFAHNEKNGLFGNAVHQSMIKRFNQHSIMVIKATAPSKNGIIQAVTPHVVKSKGKNKKVLKNMKNTTYLPVATCPIEPEKPNMNGFIGISTAEVFRRNHIAKKQRLQEKVNYVDLNVGTDVKVAKPVSKPPVTLETVERHLKLSSNFTSTDYTNLDGPQMAQVSHLLKREVEVWPPLHRGLVPVNPAHAVSALGELTPGGALMKGFREDNQHDFPKETEREIKHLYLSLCELLRHFWASFPPTNVTLELKVVKMHEAVLRFHQARLKPFEDRLLREYSPASLELTSHLNHLLENAYRKFGTWQQRKLQMGR